MELQPEVCDVIQKPLGRGNRDVVSAVFRRTGHGKKRVEVAEGAEGSKYNAHEVVHPLHKIGDRGERFPPAGAFGGLPSQPATL